MAYGALLLRYAGAAQLPQSTWLMFSERRAIWWPNCHTRGARAMRPRPRLARGGFVPPMLPFPSKWYSRQP